MPYSAFVIVALVIHVLINIDMFVKKDNVVGIKHYRIFLIVICAFYLVDILWGIFESNKLSTALYIDTFIYFILMGATILFWTRFVVEYLEGNKHFSYILRVVGVMFFAAEVTLLIINFWVPVLFTVDSNAVYTAYVARNIMLWTQVVVYSLITIYSTIYTFARKRKKFRRYIATSLYSVVMLTCIIIQLSDPYIPFYSIGLLIGICILDTYALSDTKEEYKSAYEDASQINESNKEKIGEALALAYTDSLTGVKSRHAFVEIEEHYDKLIAEHTAKEFAVIVFDLNGLKTINDTFGHSKGDDYIIDSIKVISSFFPFDTLYRFGGDEFVSILEGENYKNRQQWHNNFNKAIEKNLNTNKPIISSGISTYRKETDNTFRAIFYRADKMMYSRKEFLKEHSGN